MNNDLKNILKELGWSDDLILAASSVSEQVEQASVESISSEWDQVLASQTTDRNDVRIHPSSSNSFITFSLAAKV